MGMPPVSTPPRTAANVPVPFQTPTTLISSMNEASAFADQPTAPDNTSQVAGHGHVSVDKQRALIVQELENHVIASDTTFAVQMYEWLIAEDDVDAYLNLSEHYDMETKCWTTIPEEPAAEWELYNPMGTIIKDILGHFNLRTRTGVASYYHTRPRMNHVEDDGVAAQQSEPDWYMMGTGLFFLNPLPTQLKSKSKRGIELPKPTYAAALACWDGKLDSRITHITEQIGQMGVYARQILSQQSNRNFVRSLVISESRVRVLHFDRSGLKYSDLVNIHEDAHTFVRLVVGLNSHEKPECVGFDPRIQLRDGQASVGINSLKDGAEYMCRMMDSHPIFSRRAIRGRATCCWRVQDPWGEEMIFKDSWRAGDRTPEYEFLKLTWDLKGVARMVAYKDLCSTADFRGGVKGDDGFMPRIKCRLLMECYGQPLHKFRSAVQALKAMHDAINGHRNLLSRDILHRDISVNNILLGADDAPEGWRGVLIDLDMALFINARANQNIGPSDVRTGTRMFQSVNVLASYLNDSTKSAPHDHQDDLESFFYVFCLLVFGFKSEKEKHASLPSALDGWSSIKPSESYAAKSSFITRKFIPSPLLDWITPFWGPACRDLLVKFHRIVRKMNQAKEKLANIRDPSEEVLIEYKKKGIVWYREILKAFREAIDAKEKEDEEPKSREAEKGTNPSTSEVETSKSPESSSSSSPPPSPSQAQQHDEANQDLRLTDAGAESRIFGPYPSGGGASRSLQLEYIARSLSPMKRPSEDQDPGEDGNDGTRPKVKRRRQVGTYSGTLSAESESEVESAEVEALLLSSGESSTSGDI